MSFNDVIAYPRKLSILVYRYLQTWKATGEALTLVAQAYLRQLDEAKRPPKRDSWFTLAASGGGSWDGTGGPLLVGVMKPGERRTYTFRGSYYEQVLRIVLRSRDNDYQVEAFYVGGNAKGIPPLYSEEQELIAQDVGVAADVRVVIERMP